MELDLYSCGDSTMPEGERRGCMTVIRLAGGATPYTRQCGQCGGRNWHLLGKETVGLAVVMPGAIQR